MLKVQCILIRIYAIEIYYATIPATSLKRHLIELCYTLYMEKNFYMSSRKTKKVA